MLLTKIAVIRNVIKNTHPLLRQDGTSQTFKLIKSVVNHSNTNEIVLRKVLKLSWLTWIRKEPQTIEFTQQHTCLYIRGLSIWESASKFSGLVERSMIHRRQPGNAVWQTSNAAG